MLGLAPDDTGQLPAADVKRLHEFGAALHRIYGHNLIAEQGHAALSEQDAVDNNPDTFWIAPPLHGTIEVRFDKPVTFDRAVTMERLNNGQHVEDYAVEAWQDGRWKPLVRAHAIGHKKIDIFPSCTAQRIRLNLISTSGTAAIREFQIFNGNSASGR
jgi:alpha-L-fucosidase